MTDKKLSWEDTWGRINWRGDSKEVLAEVEKLIENGVDVNTKSEYGDTALMKAAEYGHTKILKRLIENGADLNVKDRFGSTALMEAARRGCAEAVEDLIDHGADMNAKNDLGETVLMYATEGGHITTAQLLIDHGAEVNAKDNIGQNVLMHAASYPYEIEINHLKNWGDLSNRDIASLIERERKASHTEVVQFLIDSGADLNMKTNYGITPLMVLSEYGYTEIVQSILASGKIDVNEVDKEGRTALFFAASYDQTAVVQLLISAGAKDLPNKKKQTAANVALANNFKKTLSAIDVDGETERKELRARIRELEEKKKKLREELTKGNPIRSEKAQRLNEERKKKKIIKQEETKMELTTKDIELVKAFGTPIKCGTERYVLELRNLDKPIHFINPKDAGTKYGDQNLKGDGQDILLLNGLTKDQIKLMDTYLAGFEVGKGKKAEEMNASEVQALLNFLENNGFNDRYCSNQAYKEKSLIPTNGRMYRRNNDECRGIVIPVGTVYSDGEKSQQASVEGALFVVDLKGGARITNVPDDYQTVKEGAKIVSYAVALSLQKARLNSNIHS